MYSSGGECSEASKTSRENTEMWRTCGNGRISGRTVAGAWSVTCATGKALADWEETIVLQQSWL